MSRHAQGSWPSRLRSARLATARAGQSRSLLRLAAALASGLGRHLRIVDLRVAAHPPHVLNPPVQVPEQAVARGAAIPDQDDLSIGEPTSGGPR